MTIKEPMCLYCRHFRSAAPGVTCDAYPVQIPVEIFAGEQWHFGEFPGDHGIHFEPTEGCPRYLLDRYRAHAEGPQLVRT
jgi:hypothetical protein